MKNSILLAFVLLLLSNIIGAQNTKVEGYVYEDGNRGYLNQVSVNIYETETDVFVLTAETDKEGFFSFELPSGKNYRLEASKSIFEMKEVDFKIEGDAKVFLKVPMMREDGYLFEVTLAPKREDEDEVVDAITGSLIEVYNNTTEKEILVLENHPNPDFKIHFKKGNHYTVMIRKEGYLVKRMEAFVNVEGCILCFEGVGEVKPGVSDNLTEGMSMGTLLANVEMEPIYEGKVIELQYVYYEFGKSELTKQGRESLSKLASILKDNPHLNVELGSHTDVRGTGPANRALSDERAKSAVDYLTKVKEVPSDRIIAKGYGESQIKNKCLPGVTCTDEEHAENRRTEIKILQLDENAIPLQSLSGMKVEENFMRKLLGGEVEQVNNKKAIENEEPPMNKSKDVDSANEDKSSNGGASSEEKGDDEAFSKKVKEARLAMKEAETNGGDMEKPVQKASQANEKVIKPQDAILTMPKKEKDRLEVGNEFLVKRKALNSPVDEESEIMPMEGFTGFKVVIHFSNFPISGDHPLYKNFEDVTDFQTVEKNTLYMIGEFTNQKEAEEFRKRKIEENYPSSYVVRFANGQKIKLE